MTAKEESNPVDQRPSPSAAVSQTLRFEGFTLLPGEHRLLRGDVALPIGPRAFDVLHMLAARPGQLVTKDELLATVWHGLVVEEANLHVQVSQLRKVVGAHVIATVAGLGYRFECPLHEPPVAAPATRRLSVIVLPFIENGVAPDQDYFADAITDDITTQLSKIKGSTVIGSPTAFAFKRQPVDVGALAHELGVRYVLQGRIDRGGDGLEVNARLSDAATGAVIWSDVIEVGCTGVQHIRREVVARLANALDLELHSEEARRLAMLAASSPPEAMDLVMQGRAAGGHNWSRAHHEQALACFERALALDPENVEALSWRASTLVLLHTAWPGPDLAQQIARAEADVQRALSIDSLDARNYRTLSMVRNQQYRLNEAIEALETALELNPNDARAWSFRGELQRYAGRAELAFEPLERALRLSPRDPHRWLTYLRLGMAAVSLGDHARALPWLDRAWALNAHWTIPPYRAAACVRTGELERAFELQPLYSPESLLNRQWLRVSGQPVFFSQLREHLCSPLVEAGLVPDYSLFDDWAARQRRGGL